VKTSKKLNHGKTSILHSMHLYFLTLAHYCLFLIRLKRKQLPYYSCSLSTVAVNISVILIYND